MKNIRDYIGKEYAIQCSSKEEWQKIMNLAPDELSITTNRFNESFAKILDLKGFGRFWSADTKEQIEATGYTILPASDFLSIDMKTIQEEAKKRFPIGCKFKNTGGRIVDKLQKDEYVYTISGKNNILASRGHGLLYEYETDKWAELISLPGETKKEMFYKGDYIVTLINDGDCGKVNYCSKQRKDGSSLKPVIDTKGYHHNDNWEFLASDTSNTKWRYATPEEIAEYERIGKPYDVTTLHKQPNFVVGKWYKYNKWYIKYSHTDPGNIFVSSEEISPSKVHEYCKSLFGECNSEKIELTDLSEIQQYLPEGHPDKIVKPKSLVGRYLKALVNNPSAGSNVQKGDYGVIVDSTFVDFPNNKGYSCSAAILYFTKNPNEQFYEDSYELMPEGFKPPEKLPRYVKCVEGYGNAKLGCIYDTSNNEESQKLFHLTWKEVLIDFEHLGNKFEISTKEEFEKQSNSTLMTPKEALEECKRRYRKGMVVNSTYKEGMYSGVFEITENPDKFRITGEGIDYSLSKGFLYLRGEFAEIITAPNEESVIGSLSYAPPTNPVITIVGGETATNFNEAKKWYEKLYDLYYQQEQEQPHIVNVQTTCVNLRTKTKNKYLTL